MYCIEPGESLVEAGIKKFSYTDLVNYSTCRFEDWEEKVADIINRNGGFIERPYLCVLFLAQKF